MRLPSFFLCLPALVFASCDGAEPPGCDDPCQCGQACIPQQPPRTVDAAPDWGPDGRIAYTHTPLEPDSLGFDQIWVLDPTTGEREAITSGRLPDWSPNGRHLAFVRDSRIWRIDLETREERQLTVEGDSGSPAWSSDGTRIAFSAGQSFTGSRDSVGVWTMDSNGEDYTYYVGDGASADWLPRENVLVFGPGLRDVSPYTELALLSLDDREITRLTDNEYDERYPAFSPEGTMIAWTALGEGLDNPANGVWTMRADGSQKQLLTPGAGAPGSTHRLVYPGHPSWSPDGARLVYSAYNADSYTASLWTVNADGSDPRPLTAPEDYPDWAAALEQNGPFRP